MRKLMLLNSWEQVEVLGDDTRLAILELCATPRTVAEVAETLRVPRTRLYHHVKRLTDHGFLRVAQTRQVGPVTESYYQITALSYRPSSRLLGTLSESAMGGAILTIIFGPARADFVRSLEKGAFRLGERTGRKRLLLSRSLMKLTPEELEELVAGVEELLARFDTDPTADRPGTIPVSAVSLIHPRWDRTT